MAIFDSLVDEGRAISRILSSGVLPSIMELMDQASIVAVENYEPSGLPLDAEAMIMIEFDGHPSTVRDEAEQVSVATLFYRFSLSIGLDNMEITVV